MVWVVSYILHGLGGIMQGLISRRIRRTYWSLEISNPSTTALILRVVDVCIIDLLCSVSSNIAQAFLSAILDSFLDTELQVYVHIRIPSSTTILSL